MVDLFPLSDGSGLSKRRGKLEERERFQNRGQSKFLPFSIQVRGAPLRVRYPTDENEDPGFKYVLKSTSCLTRDFSLFSEISRVSDDYLESDKLSSRILQRIQDDRGASWSRIDLRDREM